MVIRKITALLKKKSRSPSHRSSKPSFIKDSLHQKLHLSRTLSYIKNIQMNLLNSISSHFDLPSRPKMSTKDHFEKHNTQKEQLRASAEYPDLTPQDALQKRVLARWIHKQWFIKDGMRHIICRGMCIT